MKHWNSRKPQSIIIRFIFCSLLIFFTFLNGVPTVAGEISNKCRVLLEMRPEGVTASLPILINSGRTLEEFLLPMQRVQQRSAGFIGAQVRFTGSRSAFEAVLGRLQRELDLPSESVVRTEMNPEYAENALQQTLAEEATKMAIANTLTEDVILVVEGFVPIAGRVPRSSKGSQTTSHLILQQATENATKQGHFRYIRYGEFYGQSGKKILIIMPVVPHDPNGAPYAENFVQNSFDDSIQTVMGTFWNFSFIEDGY